MMMMMMWQKSWHFIRNCQKSKLKQPLHFYFKIFWNFPRLHSFSWNVYFSRWKYGFKIIATNRRDKPRRRLWQSQAAVQDALLFLFWWRMVNHVHHQTLMLINQVRIKIQFYKELRDIKAISICLFFICTCHVPICSNPSNLFVCLSTPGLE